MATVLVTGSAGRIGKAAVAELATRGHRVRGFDRVETPGLADSMVGQITDPAAVRQAMQGIDTLIHLAATPDDADVLAELVPNNIVGVFHVFEAVRAAGVQRMILASSGQVVWGQRLTGPWPITANAVPSPRYWYAATKMFLESIGRSYADKHGISVIVTRFGWCPRDPGQVEEIRQSDWAQDVYLSPQDAGRYCACAVEAPASLRFAVVYATSRPTRPPRLDLTPARELLGYEPQESWPQVIDQVLQGR